MFCLPSTNTAYWSNNYTLIGDLSILLISALPISDKDVQMRLDISGSQVHVASHIMCRLKGICNFLVPRYTSKSQVYVAPHVLIRLGSICNLLGQKNTLRLMI